MQEETQSALKTKEFLLKVYCEVLEKIPEYHEISEFQKQI